MMTYEDIKKLSFEEMKALPMKAKQEILWDMLSRNMFSDWKNTYDL